VPVNTYQLIKFQRSISISFRDIKGVPIFNVGILAPCRTPYAKTFLCGSSTWQDQTLPYFSVAAVYIVDLRLICICHRLILYVPQYVFFSFEGEDVKILCSNPQKALPCLNTRLMAYHKSKSV